MLSSARLRALALSLPKAVRTNDHWVLNHPDVIRDAVERAAHKVWVAPQDPAAAGPFLTEMAPYLRDPFRGTVERRIMRPDQTALDLELPAARRALDAAKVRAEDIDLLIACSFLGDHVGVGNASFLASTLGIGGGAWNMEAACSSSLAALQTAFALASSGQARRILVVTSCTYSRVTDERDTLAWTVGDGAAAFVVEAVADGPGIIGAKLQHTGPTCGTLYYEMYNNAKNEPSIRMRATDKASGRLRQVSEECLVQCCQGAAEAARVRLDDIRYFVFNTPTAWYRDFCVRALGIDRERAVDVYPKIGNVGPVLMPANLYELARTKDLKRGDLVMLYSIGSVSTAGAVVMRWGDLALAPDVDTP